MKASFLFCHLTELYVLLYYISFTVVALHILYIQYLSIFIGHVMN